MSVGISCKPVRMEGMIHSRLQGNKGGEKDNTDKDAIPLGQHLVKNIPLIGFILCGGSCDMSLSFSGILQILHHHLQF